MDAIRGNFLIFSKQLICRTLVESSVLEYVINFYLTSNIFQNTILI